MDIIDFSNNQILSEIKNDIQINQNVTTVIGVDPGMKTGTGALLHYNTRYAEYQFMFFDWSNAIECFNWIRKINHFIPQGKQLIVGIENVHSIPFIKTNYVTGEKEFRSQKGSVNFEFGRNAGLWEMASIACSAQYVFVSPQEWQSGVRLPKKKSKSDKPGFGYARQIFPHADLKFKTKHHNRADALLIALYTMLFYDKIKQNGRFQNVLN